MPIESLVGDRDHCSELGVPVHASVEQIKAAFRRLVLVYHPDKNPEDPGGAQEKFVRIKAAHDYLIKTRSSGNDAMPSGIRKTATGSFSNSFSKPSKPFSNPSPTFNTDTTRYKLSLTFEEFVKGRVLRVPLQKRQPSTSATAPERKLLEVRIPPGAFPEEVYYGYLMNTSKGGPPVSTSIQDDTVQFVLADRPCQQFIRDSTYPGSAHLRYILDVPAADWISLETGAVDYLELKVPTISGETITHHFTKMLFKNGGKGGSDERADGKVGSHDTAPAPSKMVKQFRLRDQGLPLSIWSPLRGDLIVFINVLAAGETTGTSNSN